MRIRLAWLVLLACAFGPRFAEAEKARAKEAAKVYNRAGERGKVVLRIKKGQVMRIDRKEGRWYKVRVSGRTGWIPRTKVELLDDEIVRNTRRRPFVDGRGTKRGWTSDSGPSDRIGADALDVDAGGGGGDEADDGDDGDEPDDGDDGDEPDDRPRRGRDDGDDGDDGDTDGDEPMISDDADPEETDTRPRVRVIAKATIYDEADLDGEVSYWKVKRDEVLFLTGITKGKFTEVENDEGDIGFILSSKIEDVDGGGRGGGRPGKPQLDVGGRLGVTLLQQGLRSDGPNMYPDNYNLSTSAATIALGGSYLRPYGKRYVIGVDANLDIAKAIPGIKDPDTGNNVGVTLYHANLRALVGYDLKRPSGMMAFARLGLRYQSYQVSNVDDLTKNTLGLPSEILTAPSIGAALAVPRLTDKIGLQLAVDAVIAGASLKQTQNLEDGSGGSAKGVILGAGLTYRWKKDMDLRAIYELNFTSYNFGPPVATSMRGHMGTGDVTRTDVFHGVTVGVAKAF